MTLSTGIADLALRIAAEFKNLRQTDISPLATAIENLSGPGSATNPHLSPSAARNSNFVVNFYKTSTEPTTWLDGDEWIKV